MQLTRDRILEEVAELLASDEVVELTVAEAAARARVSVRTAYRYFPTKEALIDGFNVWMLGQFGNVELPKTLDGLGEYVALLFRAFGENDRLIRASRRSQQGAEVRKRRKAVQARAITRLVAAAAPNLDANTVRRRAAAFHDAFGSDTYLQMVDVWRLTNDECIESAQWALDALMAKLRNDNQGAAKSGR